jgi:outer membrane protein OmpA-like peptidoglycan-associated protein/opacity protein-like surface antigen
MRKLAIAVALSTTVLAGPALARDGAWYVGGDFGPSIVEDVDIALPGSQNVNLDFDYGVDGSVFVGYDFGAFRIEAEASYKQADVEEIDSTIPLPGTGTQRGFREAGGGEANVLSFMLNGMFDFGEDDGLSGFIGGGVGIARVDFGNVRAFANRGAFLDDSDTRFAWQAIAGVRQALTPNVDLHLRYRLFNVNDVQMATFNGTNISAEYRSHSILGGITFNFGVPTPAPECLAPNFLDANGVCVAPQPPAPVICPPGTTGPDAAGQCTPIPPQMITCPDGTSVPQGTQCPAAPQLGPVIVYFGWDQDELTAEARGRLDEAAANYQRTGQAQIVIAGHADRSGSDRYNVGLSQRRANNVRDYLANRGVSAGSMTTQAFGEGRPQVETADGVREPQNRRVEIGFGPGSGW